MSIMNDDECLMSPVNKRSRYMPWHDKKMHSVDNNRQPFRSLRFPLKLVLAENTETLTNDRFMTKMTMICLWIIEIPIMTTF